MVLYGFYVCFLDPGVCLCSIGLMDPLAVLHKALYLVPSYSYLEMFIHQLLYGS